MSRHFLPVLHPEPPLCATTGLKNGSRLPRLEYSLGLSFSFSSGLSPAFACSLVSAFGSAAATALVVEVGFSFGILGTITLTGVNFSAFGPGFLAASFGAGLGLAAIAFAGTAATAGFAVSGAAGVADLATAGVAGFMAGL